MYMLRMSRFVDGEENGLSAQVTMRLLVEMVEGGAMVSGTGKGGWTANAALIDVCYHQWC